MTTCRRFVLVAGAVFLVGVAATAQESRPLQPVPLWPAGAPGVHGNTPDDVPTLTPFWPAAAAATGAAMIVCPGGAY
ncbi:MAG: alpha/beta hydrolase, partial [Terriglobales bacterium]